MSATAVSHEEEHSPLLRDRNRWLKSPGRPSVNLQNWFSHPPRSHDTTVRNTRQSVACFLSSKAGHYSVLGLVTLDVLAIIADFILNLFKCESEKEGPEWDTALNALGILSLAFSCLFMLELIASVWAFGWSYFHSRFHCFDALVVLTGFVVDVLLHGILEEAASLVVILRLWRVFKIIEELSVGASEQTEELEHRVKELENENGLLRKELEQMKALPAK